MRKSSYKRSSDKRSSDKRSSDKRSSYKRSSYKRSSDKHSSYKSEVPEQFLEIDTHDCIVCLLHKLYFLVNKLKIA